jgi:hypothetical protein
MINNYESINNAELILIQRNFNRMTSLLNFINTQGSVDQSLLKYEYVIQLTNLLFCC